MSKKREETPDLLSQIARGARQPGKPSKQRDSKSADEKTKCTYYFQTETADLFDLAWLELRKATRDRDRKLTKSELAETAVLLLLEQLENDQQRQRIIDLLS